MNTSKFLPQRVYDKITKKLEENFQTQESLSDHWIDIEITKEELQFFTYHETVIDGKIYVQFEIDLYFYDSSDPDLFIYSTDEDGIQYLFETLN